MTSFVAAFLMLCPLLTLAQADRLGLDPARGSEIGSVYQAWLSPQQEGGEERDVQGMREPEHVGDQPVVVVQ